MNLKNINDATEYKRLVEQVSAEANKVLSEHERFLWFVSQLKRRRDDYSVTQLTHYLYETPSWPAQHERVLVLLSLHDDPSARDAIVDYEPQSATQRYFRAFALNFRTSNKTLTSPPRSWF